MKPQSLHQSDTYGIYLKLIQQKPATSILHKTRIHRSTPKTPTIGEVLVIRPQTQKIETTSL
jgi:hypothetical protein